MRMTVRFVSRGLPSARKNRSAFAGVIAGGRIELHSESRRKSTMWPKSRQLHVLISHRSPIFHIFCSSSATGAWHDVTGWRHEAGGRPWCNSTEPAVLLTTSLTCWWIIDPIAAHRVNVARLGGYGACWEEGGGGGWGNSPSGEKVFPRPLLVFFLPVSIFSERITHWWQNFCGIDDPVVDTAREGRHRDPGFLTTSFAG